MDKTDLQIVMLSNEFPPVSGGVGSYCKGFAAALVNSGADVRVVAARKTNGDDAYDADVKLNVFRAHQTLPVIRHFARAWQVVRAMKGRGCDQLLWAAEWRSGIVLAFISRLFSRRLVITIHGTELLELEKSRFKRAFALPVYARASRIIAISDYVAGLIAEKLPQYAHKVVTIKNGINAEDFSEVPDGEVTRLLERYGLEGRKIILSLCRLVPRKGIDVTLEAFSLLRKEGVDAVLVIAGTGPDEARLKTMAGALGLEDSVRFIGYVPDSEVRVWYYACDSYIMLSRKDDFFVEGFGLTFLEANACGIPVVGGRHGGVVDAIKDGETGFLVDPMDAPAAAEKLRLLLEDSVLYSRVSDQSREYVQGQGSWDRAAREFCEMALEICV